MYYLKLYDRNKVLKDNCEIYFFSNLTYTKTLNGTGNLSFNTPIKYIKENEINFMPGDCIELYLSENNSEECIWWGVVVNPSNSGLNQMGVICEGYFSCLKNRMQKHLFDFAISSNNMEYLEETYTNVGHGELILSLIGTQNYYDNTGVTQGVNKDYSNIKTTRVIKWDDKLDEKINEFIEDGCLYFNIDQNRKMNIYSEYGEDKSEFYIVHDGNLIDCSQAIIDYSQIINQVYVLNQFTEELEDGTSVDRSVYYIAEDKESIKLFGLRQEVLSVNDIRLVETAKEKAEQELKKVSSPIVNIELEANITDDLDIFHIEPGDYIGIDSELLNLKGKYRVMEYTVDISNNTVKINLGNCIFRKNNIVSYRY